MKNAIRKTATRGEPSAPPFLNWDNVKATGDYALDCEIGRKIALSYLAYEEANGENRGGHLAGIVEKMPRSLTGVEISFLQIVSFAAAAGADRGRQVVGYWKRCSKKAG